MGPAPSPLVYRIRYHQEPFPSRMNRLITPVTLANSSICDKTTVFGNHSRVPIKKSVDSSPSSRYVEEVDFDLRRFLPYPALARCTEHQPALPAIPGFLDAATHRLRRLNDTLWLSFRAPEGQAIFLDRIVPILRLIFSSVFRPAPQTFGFHAGSARVLAAVSSRTRLTSTDKKQGD